MEYNKAGMLKERYTQITFPFVDGKPDTVFPAYMKELEISGLDNFDAIRSIFLHSLRDYLEGYIDEWAYESVCFEIITDPDAKKIFKLGKSKIEKYISEGSDILWLSRGEGFEEYKEELKQFLKQMLE